MTFLGVTLLTLAAYRITRLLIEDYILSGPRDKLFDKIKSKDTPARGMLLYLLTCYWCLGLWVAVILAIPYIFFPDAMMVVALPFAISTVVGLIDQKVG